MGQRLDQQSGADIAVKELPRSPDLATLLRLAIRSNQATIHVSLPGVVEAYDVAAQRADIQPLLRRNLVARDGSELAPESLPILHDVPIIFPRGGSGTGAFFISWPLAAGDHVLLVFIERSIDQWFAGNGEETTPAWKKTIIEEERPPMIEIPEYNELMASRK